MIIIISYIGSSEVVPLLWNTTIPRNFRKLRNMYSVCLISTYSCYENFEPAETDDHRRFTALKFTMTKLVITYYCKESINFANKQY